MLMGEQIHLTTLDAANAETVRRWINDPEINRWLIAGQVPLSEAAEAAFYQETEASASDYLFEIHVTADDRYIGNCGVNDVDLVHGHAEVGIVIGEADAQGQGFGRDAIVTLLRFGFDTLGLHRIHIRHIDGNERAAQLYPSIGFRPIGREREHLFIRGSWRDEFALDMLDREFRERYGRQDV